MVDVELTTLTDAELTELERAHPRVFGYPLSGENEYPNALFAERQHRHDARIRVTRYPSA
jgi:hypothetical protein